MIKDVLTPINYFVWFILTAPTVYDDSVSPTNYTSNFTPVYGEYDETDDLPPSTPDTTTTVTNGDSKEPIHHLNDKLIPIYCSILAAVVVGLVAFIIFKR